MSIFSSSLATTVTFRHECNILERDDRQQSFSNVFRCYISYLLCFLNKWSWSSCVIGVHCSMFFFFLVFIVCSLLSTPLKNISFTWKRHPYCLRAVKSRSLLGRYAPWARRDLYRAEPAVAREGHGFFRSQIDTIRQGLLRTYSNPSLEFLFTENYWSHDHKWEYS